MDGRRRPVGGRRVANEVWKEGHRDGGRDNIGANREEEKESTEEGKREFSFFTT